MFNNDYTELDNKTNNVPLAITIDPAMESSISFYGLNWYGIYKICNKVYFTYVRFKVNTTVVAWTNLFILPHFTVRNTIFSTPCSSDYRSVYASENHIVAIEGLPAGNTYSFEIIYTIR